MPAIKKIKHLRINPLSVAKFFWEKGVEDMAVMQLILYFLFIEVLKKEKILLFEEEFEAWSNGPVARSVFDKMHDNCQYLTKLFKPVKDVDNELVLDYAEKTYRKYKNTEQYRSSRKPKINLEKMLASP